MTFARAAALSIFAVIGIVGYFQFSNPHQARAASSGDYRAVATGNWSSTSTWQTYNGSSWVSAGSAPSTGHNIEIQSPYTVTVNSGTTANGITVDAGATLSVASGQTLTVSHNTGNDITVNGTMTNSGTITQNASSVVAVNGSFTNTGVLTVNGSASFTVNNGASFSSPGTISGTVSMASGSSYTHNIDGGTIPTLTWATGSTCQITGVVSTVPAGLNQSFYNFTWNCIGQTATIALGNTFNTINGTLTITSTGSGELDLFSVNNTLTISGDYIQTGGTFNLGTHNGSKTATVNVGGNWSQTGGTITVGGNVATNAEIVFNKSGTQTFTASGGIISGNVDLTIGSSSILDAGTNILTGRNFTLSGGGGLNIASAAGITSSGATGNVQSTGTRSFSTTANYTYNGASAQNTGSGLPATVNNLTLNNSSGLTLTATVAVSNILTLTSGKITTGSYEVNVTNATTSSVTGHTSSNYIVGNLRRSINTSGSYDFPIGTASHYELINATFTLQLGVSNIVSSFTSGDPAPSGLPAGITYSGKTFGKMLNHGFWTLTPNSTLNAGIYAVTLYGKGQTNATSTDSTNYMVVKRHDGASSWGISGVANFLLHTASINGVTTAVTGLSTFSDFGIGEPSGGSALPIKLIYFRAKLNSDHVNLDWATAAEINNNFFTIERSQDGIGFETLLTKPGAGNSTTDLYYNTVDDTPLGGGYSYYRLKQTDYDGHYTYSNIESIKYGGGDKTEPAPDIKIESVAPNPFIESFKLNFILKTATVVDVQIFNTSGQLVYSSKMQTVDGFNTYEFRDDTNLPKGIYFVNLSYAGKRVTQKIVKQ